MDEFRTLVNERLQAVFAAALREAAAIDSVYVELLTVTRDQILRSGKRLRPYVFHTAYLGCGGEESADGLAVAAALELVHHYLLIHDDVIDRDLVRYGSPNVAGQFGTRLQALGLTETEAGHYGASYAILAGNACCVLSQQCLLQTSFPAERKLAALTQVQTMLFEEMGGQLTDVSVSLATSETPSLDQLLRICRYKTASYSFETPLRLGAVLAGAGRPTELGLAEFGRSLGVAFQLADDLLGLYGDEVRLGKPVLSDLQEGKHTMLIHYALEAATPGVRRRLLKLWGNPTGGQAQLETVRELVRDTGAQAKTQALAEQYVRRSLDALQSTAVSSSAKLKLTKLARFCVERNY